MFHSSMSLVFLLILLLFVKKVFGDSSMMIISGKPKDFTDSYKILESWDNCLRICRNDSNCVMIYKISDTLCEVFQFGEITSVDRSSLASDGVIAFKVKSSFDQCPSDNPFYSSKSISYLNLNETENELYNTTYTYSNGSLDIQYSITKCPNDTQIFIREQLAVCIGLFYFPSPNLCNNQPKASALCKENNGTLTGPANSNEYAYIQAQSQASYNTSNPGKYSYLTYWIDGVSLSGKYNYAFEDPTHNGIANYVWAENCPLYQSAGYCLYNPNAKGYYISDIE
uniref:CW domain-containing protein n=2 Tax=Caenorhabditis tropicalis TaxID=1561998 RepID=A0A1I7ULM7_9PELO